MKQEAAATPKKQADNKAMTKPLGITVVSAALFVIFRYAVKVPTLSALVAELAAVWLVYGVVALALTLLQNHIDKKKAANNKETTAEGVATAVAMLSSIVKYAAVIVTVLALLRVAGVDTATILAAAGIVSLVVGFASQSLIEDVITGIFILFEGQYQIGDMLVLGDFRGTVIDIGVRTTTLEDVGGNRLIVNNSDIRNVQNRSRRESKAVTTVSVTYGQNMIELENILREALPTWKDIPEYKGLFLEDPSYNGIDEFQDSGILLHFSVKTNEENIFKARRALNRELKLLFDKKGIEIPFPQVDVHTK